MYVHCNGQCLRFMHGWSLVSSTGKDFVNLYLIIKLSFSYSKIIMINYSLMSSKLF